MVVRQPHLLLYLTPTLGAHLAALRDALRVPHAVAGAMVQAFPHLLLWSPAALQVRLRHAWGAVLGARCEGKGLGFGGHASAHALFRGHQARWMLIPAPPPLCCTLQAKLTTLQRGFNLPPLRVSELVSCHPKLLTYSVTRLLASREQLVQGLGMEEGALQDVVRHCPQLLLEAPATVGLVSELGRGLVWGCRGQRQRQGQGGGSLMGAGDSGKDHCGLATWGVGEHLGWMAGPGAK